MASPGPAQMPSTAGLPDHIQPQGFAATIVGVTALMSLLCLVSVSLRMWVRIHDRIFHVEDGFMLAGLCAILLQYGVVIWGTTVGIGSSDTAVLRNPLLLKSLAQVQYHLNLTYLLSMGLVKVSVCGTLLRINQGSRRRGTTWALWTVMTVIVVSTLGGLITFITRCSSTTGCLDNNRTMSIMNWVGVAFYMACDLALTIIPIFIIKDLRMKRSLKVSTGVILGLGGIACLAAILRIPAQLGVFGSGSSAMYNLGNFILWSEIELGLGIVCGCAPAIRKLLKGWLRDPPTKSSSSLMLPRGGGGRPYYPPPGGDAPNDDHTPRSGRGQGARPGRVPATPTTEKTLHGLSPQDSRSIAFPTKTFATTVATDSTVRSTPRRSLDLDYSRSGDGSERGLVEYRVPQDVEAAGLWGPRV